jgi:hypothetical protein
MAFLSPEIAASINIYVRFSLSWIVKFGLFIIIIIIIIIIKGCTQFCAVYAILFSFIKRLCVDSLQSVQRCKLAEPQRKQTSALWRCGCRTKAPGEQHYMSDRSRLGQSRGTELQLKHPNHSEYTAPQ